MEFWAVQAVRAGELRAPQCATGPSSLRSREDCLPPSSGATGDLGPGRPFGQLGGRTGPFMPKSGLDCG
jgi:hypothetical protein